MNSSKLDELLSKYKIPLALGLVGVVLLIGGVISSGILPKTFVKSSKSIAPSASQAPKTSSLVLSIAKVDVAGEVEKPGVYSLPIESRVEDALRAAGGVTESADPVYISKSLNLAQKISDGMKIYIPKVSEAGPSAMVLGVSGNPGPTDPININTALNTDLDKLPGIGEATAQKIISGRPYSGIEELLTKKVVTRSVYDKIKNLIIVN